MLPFLVLVSSTLIARATGLVFASLDSWQTALRAGLCVMFLFTAMAHFHPKLRPGILAMVPERLPARAALVTVTGVAEIAGAIGLLIPPLASFAVIGLCALLVAMFPANVRAARLRTQIADYKATPLPLRAVLQVVFGVALIGAVL